MIIFYIKHNKGNIFRHQMTKIKTLWTQEHVDKLNEYQKSGQFHPYTCGSGNRTDEHHLDGQGILVATLDGWKCPYCDYTQTWSHSH